MSAHFVITGEALTSIARDIVMSDDPGKAWRFLADALVGEGADDVIRRVLTGELDLNGDSVKGVGVETADPDAVREYVKRIRYIYAGRVRLHGRWYRPRGVVMAYGVLDARAAMRDGKTPGTQAWGRRRAEYYAGPDGHVEAVERCGDAPSGAYVVFEPCAEPPHWQRPASDAQEAVTEYLQAGRRLAELGADTTMSPRGEASAMIRDGLVDPEDVEELRDLADSAEAELFEAQLLSIGERVRAQAGDDVFPLTLEDGRVVQVPRAPFVRWALSRLPDIRPESLPAWTCVSPVGVKMINDDPYHTDWVLGAGLTIEEGYKPNVSSPAWSKAGEIQIAEVDRD